MDFESSFRMFLESFRLPGEAQKIARVMEAFGQEYFRQCPDVFHDADVVYVLAYSTILLNTDQHNPMVRVLSRRYLGIAAPSCSPELIESYIMERF